MVRFRIIRQLQRVRHPEYCYLYGCTIYPFLKVFEDSQETFFKKFLERVWAEPKVLETVLGSGTKTVAGAMDALKRTELHPLAVFPLLKVLKGMP